MKRKEMNNTSSINLFCWSITITCLGSNNIHRPILPSLTTVL